MKQILITILLVIISFSLYAKDEVFFCRDLGMVIINNQNIITESQVYIKKLNSKEDYYISNSIENKKILYIYKTYCSKNWEEKVDGELTFNDVFYRDMQELRTYLVTSFLANIIKNQ